MLILRLRDPIIWVAIPTAADIVGSLGGKLLVYQVSDKYDNNEDSALSHDVIRDMDARLKRTRFDGDVFRAEVVRRSRTPPPVLPGTGSGL